MITANITAELVKWWCKLQTIPSQHTTHSICHLDFTRETCNFPSDLHCSELWQSFRSFCHNTLPLIFMMSRPGTVVHMLPTHTALWCGACNLTTHNRGKTCCWMYSNLATCNSDCPRSRLQYYCATERENESIICWHTCLNELLRLVTEYAVTTVITAHYSQYVGFPQWYCQR